ERRTGPDDDFDDDFGGGGSDDFGSDDSDDDEDEDHEDSESDDEGDDQAGQRRRRSSGGPRRLDRNRRRGGRDGDGHQKPLIQDIFKRGQEVLVQVIKEGIGTKGPTLSTYISIAGRYLVLMPGLSRVGVSRKIADIEQRHRLRDILAELKPPTGLGFIIRTAGTDRTKKELHNDLNYLLRIWQVIVKRIKAQKGPGVIHTESDMITRTLRDTFTADVDGIWIDEAGAYEHAREFLSAVMPRYANRLKLYDQTEPLFHRHNLDGEIAKIQQKKLPLPGGGSIIIEQTEALVAIDVNSGSFRADNNNAEETAYQINLAAAKEIARQLRLRDLGGVIVNDFIDMKDDKHRRSVEKAMRDAVKRDRARTKVLRISQFGLIEMTRQRIRPSLKRSVFQECAHCSGIGYVKTPESVSIEVMRMIQLAACRDSIRKVDVRVHTAVADYLVNRRRREIAQLEDSGGMMVSVIGLREVPPERMEFVCQDANGSEVPLLPPAPVAKTHHHGRRR
ncbi:MAG: Rne/Rng family ribonuclease, partial [Gemmataceae bacterium]|nr:Rne/Rng family ribonuclease [Gemmataceae bacterium]